MRFIIRQIALPPDVPRQYAVDKASDMIRSCGARVTGASICRVSVDSRKKNDIKLVYSVIADCEGIADRLIKAGFEPYAEKELTVSFGDEPVDGNIAVIGFGPAGIFAALTLAGNGFGVTVYERGKNTDERAADVEKLTNEGILDPESNVQFGAGGAGTFSDGKLITRINDPACSYVLRQLVRFGAPEDILINARPHIGTDLLRNVIRNAENHLVSLGAEIRYNTKITDVKESGRGVVLCTQGGEDYYSAAVLATGHSARDTYGMLYGRGVAMEKKPFSVGCRIEHLQRDIDRAMFGEGAEKYAGYLPHAEYNLSYREDGRGVYSFCMCPGGSVICASTEPDGVVTNGMSLHAREGINANSAVAVSILPEDIQGGVLSGVDFQRSIERAAFSVSGGFIAPAQTVGSFLHGKPNAIGEIAPTYKPGVVMTDLRAVLPKFVSSALDTGIRYFDRKIRGFASDGAVLTAPETRTSAPVRILRDAGHVSLSVPSLYPCGEGAGYAGGITSAAADGINTALKIISRFKPNN